MNREKIEIEIIKISQNGMIAFREESVPLASRIIKEIDKYNLSVAEAQTLLQKISTIIPMIIKV